MCLISILEKTCDKIIDIIFKLIWLWSSHTVFIYFIHWAIFTGHILWYQWLCWTRGCKDEHTWEFHRLNEIYHYNPTQGLSKWCDQCTFESKGPSLLIEHGMTSLKWVTFQLWLEQHFSTHRKWAKTFYE